MEVLGTMGMQRYQSVEGRSVPRKLACSAQVSKASTTTKTDIAGALGKLLSPSPAFHVVFPLFPPHNADIGLEETLLLHSSMKPGHSPDVL